MSKKFFSYVKSLLPAKRDSVTSLQSELKYLANQVSRLQEDLRVATEIVVYNQRIVKKIRKDSKTKSIKSKNVMISETYDKSKTIQISDDDFLRDITQGYIKSVVECNEILAGTTSAKKYYVKDCSGVEYFVKAYVSQRESEKKHLFTREQKLSDLFRKVKDKNNFPMLTPLEIFKGKNGIYVVYEFVHNYQLFEYLKKCNVFELYNLGERVGKALYNLHREGYQYALHQENHVRTLINNLLATEYKNEPDDRQYTELLLNYIEKNIYILDETEITLIHGDVNGVNVLIDKTTLDFQYIDYSHKTYFGNPIYDLRRIAREEFDPVFQSAFIDGYTDGKPDKNFWNNLKFYQFVAALKQIETTKRSNRSHLCTKIMNRAKRTIDSYSAGTENDLSLLIPKWYKSTKV